MCDADPPDRRPGRARALAALALTFALALVPAPVGADAMDAYRAASSAYKTLMRERAPKRHDFERVLKHLEQARLAAGPTDSWADDALFRQGRALERMAYVSGLRADWERAAQAYERVADIYTRSRLADDALFQAATIYRKRVADLDNAWEAYSAVITRYPDGDMRRHAARQLAELGLAPIQPEVAEASLAEAAEAAADAAEPEPPRPVPGELVTVQGIRHSSSADYTRVVVDLSGPVEMTSHLLRADPVTGKPPRLYMDLRPARLGPDVEDDRIDDGLLTRARAGQHDRDTVRVVVDIVSISSHSVIQLDNPSRVVVDVWGDRGKPAKPAVVALETSSPPGAAKPKAKGKSGDMLIVIDPGHGGKDPGAVGYRNMMEKDVVLDLGKRLAKKLDAVPGVRTRLTRTTDVFIPLEKRTAIANKLGADLFISLHANASRNRRARGMETYYMDNTTDRAARKIARRENALSQRAMDDLQLLFRALRTDANVVESSRLADHIQRAMSRELGRRYDEVPDLGVKKALFFVLFNANMPSVLVESAFVTNRHDARLLGSDAFLDDMADSIVAGVRTYIATAPVVLTSGR